MAVIVDVDTPPHPQKEGGGTHPSARRRSRREKWRFLWGEDAVRAGGDVRASSDVVWWGNTKYKGASLHKRNHCGECWTKKKMIPSLLILYNDGRRPILKHGLDPS
uniref:Kinase-like protein n=1 Tax=Oryza sativa subsp. japonica TaxID=39947 RepID=C6YXK1_ORYSJ|nr:kinase-like protein [Oryza sativa Japonica Group]